MNWNNLGMLLLATLFAWKSAAAFPWQFFPKLKQCLYNYDKVQLRLVKQVFPLPVFFIAIFRFLRICSGNGNAAGVYELLCAQRASMLHRWSCVKEAWVKPSSRPSAVKPAHTIPLVDSHIFHALSDCLSWHILNKTIRASILQSHVKYKLC